MASLSVAAAASAAATAAVAAKNPRQSRQVAARVVFFRLASKPKPKLLLFSSKVSRLNRSTNKSSVVTKAIPNEVIGGASNDSASTGLKPEEVPISKGKDVEPSAKKASAPMSEEAISEFMAQVASLVKHVDSTDIVELQLVQNDCEVTIRKKEALPQPPQAPVVMMHSSAPPAAMPQQYAPLLPPPAPAALVPGGSGGAPAAPAAAPKSSKSSHPPLKSPMAGTFYRSPGPGQPSFVKVGDKVNKGQVLCIIEAMKLMNEIEADQAGTVVEILAEDAKPVGVEQPLFVIEP